MYVTRGGVCMKGKMDVTEKVRAGCMHGARERWVTWKEGHGTISKGNLVVYHLGITTACSST